MRTITNFVITLAAVTLFAACSNPQKTAESNAHEGHSHAAGEGHAETTEKGTATVNLKDDKLNAVYQHYVHLTNALVKGDVAEAKVAANAIELGAKDLANGASLVALVSKIGSAADVDAQRIAYAELSTNFIERVKASGLSSGEIYVDYCPMALNDKGASWLSNQKEIKNPYFGENMLACGEVKETIK
nr:DUF3347 domain-containing protein [uncultured Pedobacter sp.]